MKRTLLASAVLLSILTACGGGGDGILIWSVPAYKATTPTTAAAEPATLTLDGANAITLAANDIQVISGTVAAPKLTKSSKTPNAPSYTLLSQAEAGVIQLCDSGVSKNVLTAASATKLSSADVATLVGKTFDYYQDCAVAATLTFAITMPTLGTDFFATYIDSQGDKVSITLDTIKANLDGQPTPDPFNTATALDHLWFYKYVSTDISTNTSKTFYFIAESQELNGTRIVGYYVAR
ncbi:hypothetical protein ACMYR3_02610 [Ampullimonas aquatilis]|uniref:hypothetical protein n=1 Tax=Ampullimonas aquatilis TaxID=1341549 RepID=UPI003C73CD9D